MFGVFDGHGGQEVAKFTKKTYPGILQKESLFTQGEDVKEGLRRSFLNVDVEITSPDGQKFLEDMKKENPPAKSPLMKIL